MTRRSQLWVAGAALLAVLLWGWWELPLSSLYYTPPTRAKLAAWDEEDYAAPPLPATHLDGARATALLTALERLPRRLGELGTCTPSETYEVDLFAGAKRVAEVLVGDCGFVQVTPPGASLYYGGLSGAGPAFKKGVRAAHRA